MLGTHCINCPPICSGEAQQSSLPPARESAITTGSDGGNSRKPSTGLSHRRGRRQSSRIEAGVPRRDRDSPDNHTCASGSSAQRQALDPNKEAQLAPHTSGSAGPERKRNPPRARWTRIVFAVGWIFATQQRRSASIAEVPVPVPLLSHPAATEWEIRPPLARLDSVDRHGSVLLLRHGRAAVSAASSEQHDGASALPGRGRRASGSES